MNLKHIMASGIDFLDIVISKDEIIQNDTSKILTILKQLVADIEVAKYFREKINISIDGYNNTTKELWKIVEVRDFILALDEAFPYWLFFLSKNGSGLFVIIKCFLLPFLKPEVDKEINGQRLQQYLEDIGFPAMNDMCDRVGISNQENKKMTDRFVNYLQKK